ncbi:hypothetical protein JTE90_005605, partial [Oedothorax gibbosus]
DPYENKENYIVRAEHIYAKGFPWKYA